MVDPSTLGCGHSGCFGCLQASLTCSDPPGRCPTCSEQHTGSLSINFLMADIIGRRHRRDPGWQEEAAQARARQASRLEELGLLEEAADALRRAAAGAETGLDRTAVRGYRKAAADLAIRAKEAVRILGLYVARWGTCTQAWNGDRCVCGGPFSPMTKRSVAAGQVGSKEAQVPANLRTGFEVRQPGKVTIRPVRATVRRTGQHRQIMLRSDDFHSVRRRRAHSNCSDGGAAFVPSRYKWSYVS